MFFKGTYAYLSNFYPTTIYIVINGRVCQAPTVEHAYQALKCINASDAHDILNLPTPGKAKRKGRTVHIRLEWDEIKHNLMYQLLYQKFQGELLIALLAFNGKIIVHNTWHDNYWGSCVCAKCGDRGRNILGSTLMRIRENKRSES